MFQKIKNLFKSDLPEQYMSGITYRPSIEARYFEIYKDVSVVYIKRVTDFEYNTFYRRKFYADKADTLEALIEIAHKDIDEKFKNKSN